MSQDQKLTFPNRPRFPPGPGTILGPKGMRGGDSSPVSELDLLREFVYNDANLMEDFRTHRAMARIRGSASIYE
jgi:hypothetical protein